PAWTQSSLGRLNADVRLSQTLSLVLEKGKTAELQCEHNTNHDYMYWYQQHQGKGLHLIYYSFDVAELYRGNISERFTATRPQTKAFPLKISSVKPEDSAVYFCASSLDTYFGTGTKLTVLGKEKIKNPNVALFPPSKKEIKDKKKATLVCLATDFFPDHIKLVWRVNGKETSDGVKTDEPLLDESQSGNCELRVPAKQSHLLNPGAPGHGRLHSSLCQPLGGETSTGIQTCSPTSC
uniref:Ig-like domain-containing protein n=1 Tax=Pelusios castaneus TaxID=367368 RepID=A0A8C8S3L3_9SAUR